MMSMKIKYSVCVNSHDLFFLKSSLLKIKETGLLQSKQGAKKIKFHCYEIY